MSKMRRVVEVTVARWIAASANCFQTSLTQSSNALVAEGFAAGTSETLPASSRTSALRGFADMLGVEYVSRV
jgi:hypothetical protein